MEFFRKLFDSDFMPHGHCYFWKPDVLWTNVLGDAIIVLAYYAIPVALYYFVKKRKDIRFSGLFMLFAAFIFFCGTTHLLDIISVWNPIYRLEGLIKLITGIISIVTAVILVRIIPAALKIPAPEELALKTEKLERANIYLEHFAHVSSHDLKSPLSSMKALLGLMEKKQSVKEDSIKEFDLLKRSVNNLHKKVVALEQVFTQTKMHELPKEQVSLEQVVSEIQTLLADQIATNHATIISDFSEVKTLNFPHIHIRSVLKNLIDNAIKYRKDNENPVIRIVSKKSGDKILLTVSDNGIGIDLSLYKDKMFEMFRRFHDHVEGSGIGLHMVKSILDTYNASIEVESEVNKGTTFFIYFEQ